MRAKLRLDKLALARRPLAERARALQVTRRAQRESHSKWAAQPTTTTGWLLARFMYHHHGAERGEQSIGGGGGGAPKPSEQIVFARLGSTQPGFGACFALNSAVQLSQAN